MPASEQTTDVPNPSDTPTVRLVPMGPSVVGAAPEAGIGDRLKYGRGELSLSVEALARLTKRYDRHESKGVSPSSLLRYESGDSLPGARELRLLCEALAVPPQWLLLGELPNAGKNPAQQQLIKALSEFVWSVKDELVLGSESMSETVERINARQRAEAIAEARKPATP